MTDILRPVLELFVIIPGILLAYLPIKNYLRQTPLKPVSYTHLSITFISPREIIV